VADIVTNNPVTSIQGWMGDKELEWLYEQSKTKQSIVEIGSWCGRSTYALCLGCPGTVYAIDHFKGSKEHQHMIDKGVDPYKEFMKNVGHFKNLKVFKMTSLEASTLPEIPENIEMAFIDGSHEYVDVMTDLQIWSPRTKFLCGHDLGEAGVPSALKEFFGKRLKATIGSIWCRDEGNL
jgi:hypothetical protein